jgi:hypothetical protein
MSGREVRGGNSDDVASHRKPRVDKLRVSWMTYSVRCRQRIPGLFSVPTASSLLCPIFHCGFCFCSKRATVGERLGTRLQAQTTFDVPGRRSRQPCLPVDDDDVLANPPGGLSFVSDPSLLLHVHRLVKATVRQYQCDIDGDSPITHSGGTLPQSVQNDRR